jgi:hypothetical protein
VSHADVVQVRPGQRAGAWVITVAADTNRGVRYLAVPVQRRGGFLEIPSPPALVGPPATRAATDQRQEPAVEDGALREVVTRALGNYLAGRVGDLKADLAPAAVVSVPGDPLHLDGVDGVTWSARGTVAVLVRASERSGPQYPLRYELDVVRRDRWYVLAIETNPTT